jgi:hypothetical protein
MKTLYIKLNICTAVIYFTLRNLYFNYSFQLYYNLFCNVCDPTVRFQSAFYVAHPLHEAAGIA